MIDLSRTCMTWPTHPLDTHVLTSIPTAVCIILPTPENSSKLKPSTYIAKNNNERRSLAFSRSIDKQRGQSTAATTDVNMPSAVLLILCFLSLDFLLCAAVLLDEIKLRSLDWQEDD